MQLGACLVQENGVRDSKGDVDAANLSKPNESCGGWHVLRERLCLCNGESQLYKEACSDAHEDTGAAARTEVSSDRPSYGLPFLTSCMSRKW